MTVRLYLARLSRKNGQKYWGHEFDLTGLRDVIDHVTVGSAYPEYPTLEPNPKWIRCSVAKIYPCKDAGRSLRTHTPAMAQRHAV